jgi:5-methylcytosine-specific restriction enzyme subunit McrC
MQPTITVREYAKLSAGVKICQHSLDEATIFQADFDWLCQLNASFRASGAQLVHVDNRKWLRLDNYVGIMEMPSGTRIEILPKHHHENAGIDDARRLLCRMIQTALDLPHRDVGETNLTLFDAPLTEWVIQQFLVALDRLVKRGLRFDYARVEEEQRFLRGQLDMARQMRQPPGRQHWFQLRHDVLLPNRPENRLLKSALKLVAVSTDDASNWRLAHELLGMLADLPESRSIAADFKQWRHDRLMAHYEPVRPWCELILRQKMPLAISGDWQGISLLFPMERLFERFVEAGLRKTLFPLAQLHAQASHCYLCQHERENFFQLRPDFLVVGDTQSWILDAKWKRLDSKDRANQYGLSQSDFYQLYAYGQKYLQGQGDVFLVYPKTEQFNQPLQPFHFSVGLRLWAVPFDMDEECMIVATSTGLPITARQMDGIDMQVVSTPTSIATNFSA